MIGTTLTRHVVVRKLVLLQCDRSCYRSCALAAIGRRQPLCQNNHVSSGFNIPCVTPVALAAFNEEDPECALNTGVTSDPEAGLRPEPRNALTKRIRVGLLPVLWAAVATVVLIFYLGSSGRQQCKPGEVGCEVADDQANAEHGLPAQLSEEQFLAARSEIASRIIKETVPEEEPPKQSDVKLNTSHVGVNQTGDHSIRCKVSTICDGQHENCYPGSDELGCIVDTDQRRRHVEEAIKWAWKSYRSCAWGYDELKPISCKGRQWFGLGLYMIDALDTMILAGMKQDVEEVVHWIDTMDSAGEPNATSNTFECTIRVVGGLLAAAHLLDGDRRLLRPAVEVALRLMAAFKTSSGIPYSDVDLQSITARNPHWTSFSSLSEATTLSLEFGQVASYHAIAVPALHVWEVMRNIKGTTHGLAPTFLDPNRGSLGSFESNHVTLGARGDSYYEYMLKQYIIGGQQDKHLLHMYQDAMRGVRTILLGQTGQLNQGGLLYIGEWTVNSNNKLSSKMDHLVCFLPGVLALGHLYGIETGTHSHGMNDLELAEHLMRTCYMMYQLTPTGLAPELVHFIDETQSKPRRKHKGSDQRAEFSSQDDVGGGHFSVKHADSHNLLRPETVESLFILWRVTGDALYQEWGWQIFRAFEMHARLDDGGYTSLDSVLSVPAPRRDSTESFFIAETLKYLLLLFSPAEVLPLEDFVFNTEAHPFPIMNSPVERNHSAWYMDPPDGLRESISLDSTELHALISSFRDSWRRSDA